MVGFNADVGIAEALGDTTAVPPYKQYYGGGPESVRGFRESYLGPRDSFGNPYGGNVLVAGQVELILPLPDKWSSQARASIFYDVGNVFLIPAKSCSRTSSVVLSNTNPISTNCALRWVSASSG